MSQPTRFEREAGAVARLLAGAPPGDAEAATFPEPWASLVQAIVLSGGDDRLAAFDGALSGLPEDQASMVRFLVGREGRAILQGQADSDPEAPPATASTTIPDLPQESRLAPELQARAAEVGQWLDAYVSFAYEVSPLTPRELHQSAGLWLGSVAIARRVRLRLRHDDVYPNLLIL